MCRPGRSDGADGLHGVPAADAMIVSRERIPAATEAAPRQVATILAMPDDWEHTERGKRGARGRRPLRRRYSPRRGMGVPRMRTTDKEKEKRNRAGLPAACAVV